MIIWGSKGREKQVDSGEFQCPGCRSWAPYSLRRVSRYFTLYFIPVFPIANLGEYVKCGNCSGSYRPEVLEMQPPSRIERVARKIREDLEGGTPLEMAHRKVLNAGVSDQEAEEFLSAATGDDEIRHCHACGLSFLGTVERCSTCGGHLEG